MVIQASRIGLVLLLAVLVWTGDVHSETSKGKFQVLVVMSYGASSTWEREIRDEIEKKLKGSCKLEFFYLHAMTDPENLKRRAKEALAAYRHLQPDGVIAVDDPAQSAFVVPYLKNRVSTPVIFCGVNADLKMYGYPANNVTGVKSQLFLEEGIALSSQLAGPVSRFAVMLSDNPMADLIYAQIIREHPELAKKMYAFLTPKSFSEALAMAEDLRGKIDLLFLMSFSALSFDVAQTPVDGEAALKKVVEVFNKPTFSVVESAIRAGVLSGVLNSGQEEAELATEMLLSAMRGVPLNQVKVTLNHRGVRMINVSTLKKLNIVPDPMVLRGAELVRSQ